MGGLFRGEPRGGIVPWRASLGGGVVRGKNGFSFFTIFRHVTDALETDFDV